MQQAPAIETPGFTATCNEHSPGARRRLRRALSMSVARCTYCRTQARWWFIVKGVGTCPSCGGMKLTENIRPSVIAPQ